MKLPPPLMVRQDLVEFQAAEELAQGVVRIVGRGRQGQAENQGEAAQNQDANQNNATQGVRQEPALNPGQWRCKCPWPILRMHLQCNHANEADALYCTRPAEFYEPGPFSHGFTAGCGR
ncbi:predicted protein [Sclerotinia sclerotiorum 1980 UF-70]|uniref:Uncharacterized protein n=1 Tax=Sclerotinia sclerotiorum (strain ATCC 18683 / 1980 / Ss-1) TaxID=665079 RepID=A7EEP2_SCLS1|nr:predicted protein [Sclerotinia sclerotiorum 1980 UF-70]EDO01308.1 predicted protein [Sclerotinia sclerotiorum 1980 UF-70]